VRFDELLRRDPRGAFQRVDVLGEALVQQALLRDQRYEGVRDRGGELARAQGFREGVEGLRVGAEEAYVEDGLRVREVQGLEVGVEACARCAKIRDPGGG